MNKNNQFNQDEIKIDLDSMHFYNIERPELSDDEKENSSKTFEEQSKGKKTGLRFDDFFVSRPTNLAQYYLFWRIKLLYSIDPSVLKIIEENKFDEEVIHNELGLTKEEFLKPNPTVVEKAKKYLSKSKTPTKR